MRTRKPPGLSDPHFFKGNFEEHKHPRTPDGKFAPAGYGGTQQRELFPAGQDYGKSPTSSIPEQESVKTTSAMMKAASDDTTKIAKMRLNGRQGVGSTYRVEYEDGTMAVFKPDSQNNGDIPEDEREPGESDSAKIRENIDFNEVPQSHRERAAYEVDRALGFGVVPAVELVDYSKRDQNINPGDGGHAQAWVDGVVISGGGYEPYFQGLRADNLDIHRIAALDFVIGNTDRHAGNFMHGNDGRFYAIDNNLSFPKFNAEHEFFSQPWKDLAREQVYIRPEIKEALKQVDTKALGKRLADLGFSKHTIGGVMTRISDLRDSDLWGDVLPRMED